MRVPWYHLGVVFLTVILSAGFASAFEPFIPNDTNSWAFPADCPDPAAPSPIDLRFLNERIAGENGPLRLSPDGNDMVTADGKRFVAWVVHMPNGFDDSSSKDSWTFDDYRRSARFLARLGVNMGIVGVSNPSVGMQDPSTVNPVVIETLHRSVAAAREAGIYTQLRIAWFNGVKGGPQKIAGHEDKDVQCLVFYHPGVQQVWKAWAKSLLTAVNPHTGKALKDEPALFSVEIANEDSLLFYVTDKIQGGARAELERQFCAWAEKKYGSTEKALAAWSGFADKGDAPAEKRLGIMIMWMLTRDGRGKANEQRVRDQLQFLVETSRAWNKEAARYLKEEIGAKHLLVASSNFVPADRVTMDDALRLMTWKDMDLVENNHYFGDGGKPAQQGWRADFGGYLGLRSAVTDPLGLPTNKRQTEGKPFLLTEILWPRPHPFEVEGPVIVAAYQALTGLDGLAWAGPRDITWERRDKVYFTFWNVQGSMPMRPFSCAGPATLGQFPAAAAIARLGLVKQAPTVVRETRTEQQILARESQAIAEEFAYDPTQFGRGQTQDTQAAGSVPKEAFLVGRVAVSLGEQPKPVESAGLAGCIREGVVKSATGELTMDVTRKLFTINAPAVQSAVGFLAEAGDVRLSKATIRSSAPHGAVTIVALDAKPIEESGKILVQVGARCVPTGWKESPGTWEEGGKKHEGLRIDATGDLPWRVQRAEVSIVFPKLAATKVTALDGNGIPVADKAPALLRDGEQVRLTMPPDALYVILE